ncbi:hypothetical protein D3C72_563840 [compost metagenome]
MKPVITTQNSRKDQSFIRSATAPEMMEVAVATKTTWKKKSACSEWPASSAWLPIRLPKLGSQPPAPLSTYMML